MCFDDNALVCKATYSLFTFFLRTGNILMPLVNTKKTTTAFHPFDNCDILHPSSVSAIVKHKHSNIFYRLTEHIVSQMGI